MGKTEEQVWIFPACVLTKLKDLPGVSLNPSDWRVFHEEVLPVCRFMCREDVETAATLLQVIPYSVVKCDDKILVYNRGNKGGEGRLANKYSIGVGGHINPVDNRIGGPLITLREAAARELREELTPVEPETHMIVALLQSNESVVDVVHFGVVMEARYLSMPTIEASEEIASYQWVTTEELGEYELESWSQKVYEKLYK